MGSSVSTNSSDRRTNALRRSQRKTLTQSCSNIDKLIKTIKNFKGTEDTEEYKNLKIKIIQLEKKYKEKLNGEVQPQFKTMQTITDEKIKKAYELLDQIAEENSKFEKKTTPTPAIPPTSPPLSPKEEEKTSPSTSNKRNSLILRLTKLTSPKQRTSSSSDVEFKEIEADVHKTPESTRKSIMKYGVPVLPTTPNGATSPRIVSFNTPIDDYEILLKIHEKRLKEIKENIANIEIRISEFIGKKDGKHYNNLKKSLTQLIEELEEINEEQLLDQVVLCHNYIKSCLNFLDTKALDNQDIDDDVFTNYTNSNIYGSTHDLLDENKVRTTAI